MSKTKREFVDDVLKLYDTFEAKDYRKAAERELALLAMTDRLLPNIAHIVSVFPDWPGITMQHGGDGFEMTMRFDPRKYSREEAEMFASGFYDMFTMEAQGEENT